MGYFRRRGPRDATGERAPSDTDTTLLDAAIRLEPDVLVVCLGANDLQFLDTAAARVEFAVRRDLRRLRAELPAATPVVVTTYFPTARLSPRGRRIETWVRDACRDHDLHYVEHFRTAVDSDHRLLCDDGVHPNDEGHRVLADLMAPILSRLVT
jgi:lysophospholipase L1-like esterase